MIGLISLIVYLPTTLSTSQSQLVPAYNLLLDLFLSVGTLMSLVVIQQLIRVMIKAKSGLLPNR